MNNLLTQLQIFVLQRKSLIVRLWSAAEFGIIGATLLGFYLFSTQPRTFFTLSVTLGKLTGQLAFLLYCLTLTPGIINRFRWSSPVLNPIKVILTTFRRHFGISMFLTAVFHMCYTTVIPLIINNRFSLTMLTQHQILGLLALLTLMPLWLTSNDWSMKKLGHTWSTLHRITYVALLLIFLHIVLFEFETLGIIALIFVIAESASWIVHWRRQRKRKALHTSS